MKLDERTIAWCCGGTMFLVIVSTQISDWINTCQDWMSCQRYLAIALMAIGMIGGFILDQYYKKQEAKEEAEKQKDKPKDI